MKASNTQVMVQAYRLLVETMVKEGMNYPLHLGVTEAGDGEDGRIKSAVGIGTLLADGLGDTIRVSLTEDPEFEAPVARALANRFEKSGSPKFGVGSDEALTSQPSNISTVCHHELVEGQTYSPYQYKRRVTEEIENLGAHQVPRVVINLEKENLKDPAILNSVGYNYSALLDKYNLNDQACDMVYLGDELPSFSFPGGLKQLYNYQTWLGLSDKQNCHPLFNLTDFVKAEVKDEKLNFIKILVEELDVELIKNLANVVLVFTTGVENAMQTIRNAFVQLLAADIKLPVIVERTFNNLSIDDFQLYSSTDFGGLLIDGFGDAVWINAPTIPLGVINSTSFGILQATRTRISKTEYISCPSCGRTLFDLQETTQAIRARTSHLKGIKIGIMGCIVNGPGEMADADYGYVGAGPDRITLYRGQEVVKKNVKTADAINELIGIIKGDGNWVDIAN